MEEGIRPKSHGILERTKEGLQSEVQRSCEEIYVRTPEPAQFVYYLLVEGPLGRQ